MFNNNSLNCVSINVKDNLEICIYLKKIPFHQYLKHKVRSSLKFSIHCCKRDGIYFYKFTSMLFIELRRSQS